MNIHFIFPLLFFIHGVRPLESPIWDKLSKECGRTRFDNKMRIIGGEEAELGQFPWTARFGRYLRFGTLYFNCGASIISRYYLVTAAHCGKGDVVRVGEHNVMTDIDCDAVQECAPPHQDLEIERTLIFPDFISHTLMNDLSLVVLKDPVNFNEFVRPICLPPEKIPHSYLIGNMATIAGWGVNNSTAHTTDTVLTYVHLPITDAELCKKQYRRKSIGSQWCMGYPNGGKDSCAGDSGGPASMSLRVNGDRRYYLIGLTSFGLVKCGKGVAVYTDVSDYIDWILGNMEKF